LKANPKLSSIPVIFLSANQDIESEVKALASGAMDFITKPVEKGILLHRIELHLELHKYQSNLHDTLIELENNTIIAFSDLIDCKEMNSGDHAMRTSVYTGMIGNELLARRLFADELSAETVEMITRAAPLHDIGKIGVSDSILLKVAPLSGEERAAVKQHTLIGGRVLRKIYAHLPSQSYLDYAIKMAEGHHERWDGLGYPKGLKGEEIPLCCRIITAANEYDSRMIDRVYRKGCGREEAMNAIRTERGTIFDPVIAEVTESLAEKFATVEVKQKRLFFDQE
jgi:putative two-component system response regulator